MSKAKTKAVAKTDGPKGEAKPAKAAKKTAAPAKVKPQAYEHPINGLTLDLEAFESALDAHNKVIEPGNTIPILGHCMLNAVQNKAVRLVSTDMDIEIVTVLPGKSDKNLTLSMPFRQLRRVISKTDAETCAITSEEITKGDTKITVAVLSIDDLRVEGGEASRPGDFPTLALSKADKAAHTFAAETLWDALRKVRHAISTEETRYYLNGVYFDGIAKDKNVRIVATDGHRLAAFDTDRLADNLFSAIVPLKVVKLMLALLEDNPEVENVPCEFIGAQAIRFKIGAHTVTAKLIDGTYPDYRRVIVAPTECKLTLDATKAGQAIDKIVAAIGAPKHTPGGLRIAPNGQSVELSMAREESGRASITMPATSSGKPIETGVNPTYIRTVLDLLEGDELVAVYDGPSDPLLLTDPAEPRFIEVLMPMRV